MIAEAHIARGFLESHPARAAMTLEQMPSAQAAAVLRAVPPRLAARVLRDMNVSSAADLLVRLASSGAAEELAAIVTRLAVADAAAILRSMPPEARDPLLAPLPADVREPVERMLPFAVGTAGAVMDPGIFQLTDDILVVDARMRLGRATREVLHYLYVVDREQRLVGVIDIPELMMARAREPVNAIMRRDVDRINVFLPVALVREHAGWQRYHALPVVDDEDRLLGAVRYQALRRLERAASDRGPEPARLTAGALAELFRLGTSGMMAGIAATAAERREFVAQREPEAQREPDGRHGRDGQAGPEKPPAPKDQAPDAK